LIETTRLNTTTHRRCRPCHQNQINMEKQKENMKKPDNIKINVLEQGIEELNYLKEWGKYFAESETKTENGKERVIGGVSTSQIRRFFGAIKRIQADFDEMKGEIILLSPKLAYAVGRDGNKTKLQEFYNTLSPLIEDIKEDKKKFQNFVNVFEAIVAYHKAAGGN
ncbi:MAG: type III-A CRISPR-associated protein Csm2, partial [Runella sp.]